MWILQYLACSASELWQYRVFFVFLSMTLAAQWCLDDIFEMTQTVAEQDYFIVSRQNKIFFSANRMNGKDRVSLFSP